MAWVEGPAQGSRRIPAIHLLPSAGLLPLGATPRPMNRRQVPSGCSLIGRRLQTLGRINGPLAAAAFPLEYILYISPACCQSSSSCVIPLSYLLRIDPIQQTKQATKQESKHQSIPPHSVTPPSMPSLASARYGKDNVRVYKVHRDEQTGTQSVTEMTVCCLLEGEIETS